MKPHEWESMSWHARQRYERNFGKKHKPTGETVMQENVRAEAERILSMMTPDSPEVLAARRQVLESVFGWRKRHAN